MPTLYFNRQPTKEEISWVQFLRPYAHLIHAYGMFKLLKIKSSIIPNEEEFKLSFQQFELALRSRKMSVKNERTLQALGFSTIQEAVHQFNSQQFKEAEQYLSRTLAILKT